MIRADVQDTSGGTATKSTQFEVDLEPPAAVTVTFGEYQSTKNAQNIKITLLDARLVQVNNGQVSFTGDRPTYTLQNVVLEDGTNTFDFLIADQAENTTSFTAQIQDVVTNTVPEAKSDLAKRLVSWDHGSPLVYDLTSIFEDEIPSTLQFEILSANGTHQLLQDKTAIFGTENLSSDDVGNEVELLRSERPTSLAISAIPWPSPWSSRPRSRTFASCTT